MYMLRLCKWDKLLWVTGTLILCSHTISLFEVLDPHGLHDFTDEDRAKLPEESAVASGTVGEGFQHRPRDRPRYSGRISRLLIAKA